MIRFILLASLMSGSAFANEQLIVCKDSKDVCANTLKLLENPELTNVELSEDLDVYAPAAIAVAAVAAVMHTAAGGNGSDSKYQERQD